jgi:hypothetical protein
MKFENNRQAQILVENVQEVRLLRKYRKAPKANDKEVLYKSCVVLLVACWESFVEDLVSHSLEHMIECCEAPTSFPPNVLERVASNYNGQKVWQLAGEGWRQALRDNFKSVLGKTSGVFNTPRAAQVDDLVKKVIGFENLSASWEWDGKDCKTIRSELDDLITLRGSIAHRVKAESTVSAEQVGHAETLVLHLAVRSHNTVLSYLESCTSKRPWKTMRYKGQM